jgi:Transglutaminase-like superfamily
MQNENELKALLSLLDDPDEEIYNSVAKKIIGYGPVVVNKLEKIWDTSDNERVVHRAECLIKRVHYQAIQSEFMEWNKKEHPELLVGAFLIAKFDHPELNIDHLRNEFEKLRRDIWLELNNHMSPVEQINILNTMLYGYHRLQGRELSEREPAHFFLNRVFDNKTGNAYSLGILLLALCDSLDIPMFAMNIPKQFILGYFLPHADYLEPEKGIQNKVQFFLDPVNCMLYSMNDVETYLKKINAFDTEKHLQPVPTKQVIRRTMHELSLCFRHVKEAQKAEEIDELMQILFAAETES